MPVVTFHRPALCRVIGKDIPLDVLAERMPMMGGDLDGVDTDADTITIEWFPDRPDLLTLEGTGRAMRNFLNVDTAPPQYTVQPATTQLHVDPSVAQVRPYAALCFVRGVPFDDDYVKAVMDAQEKIVLAPGRKRRKIAVGIHDAGNLTGPFTYTCVKGNENPFVPLQETREMTPAQIMADHPKGREYAHLLPDGQYPVFLDGNGTVISLPPVINAAATAVTAQTRDLLIDVTGTDAQSVRRTIALLAGSFAERGGTIEAVTIHDASGTWISPDLHTTERTLHVDDVQKLLGIQLDGDAVASCLQRMGHDAEGYDTTVLVRTPAWRFDILHPVDLMEDVAIGHGFEHFPGHLPRVATFSAPLAHQGMEDRLRALMTGHGWLEARTLTLSNPHDQWEAWGGTERPSVVLENPVLEEQTILRTRLVPSLLRVLAHNRHRSLPQRLFELGYVVENQPHNAESPWQNRLHLAIVETAAKTSFSEIKGLAEAIIRDLPIPGAVLEPTHESGYISGRQGRIVVEETTVGTFGELHPDVVVAFGLGAATTALEMDLLALPESP